MNSFTDRVGQILKDLKSSKITLKEAMEALRALPYEDLGFAKVDTHRALRKGFPEVVYCPGKSHEQIVSILKVLATQSREVIATRASEDVFQVVKRSFPDKRVRYYREAGILLLGSAGRTSRGNILVVTGGTSDIPVAEEAAVTCEILGNKITRLYDVGVAGVHRLLDRRDLLEKARVIIVVAGMEGALASVVTGLVDKPVIAVPTSVGYGASFDGLAALLAMMNTCAPGSVVVNVDNGFGAGYFASMINDRSNGNQPGSMNKRTKSKRIVARRTP